MRKEALLIPNNVKSNPLTTIAISHQNPTIITSCRYKWPIPHCQSFWQWSLHHRVVSGSVRGELDCMYTYVIKDGPAQEKKRKAFSFFSPKTVKFLSEIFPQSDQKSWWAHEYITPASFVGAADISPSRLVAPQWTCTRLRRGYTHDGVFKCSLLFPASPFDLGAHLSVVAQSLNGDRSL